MSDLEKQPRPTTPVDPLALSQKIKRWGAELGFQHIGIADLNLADASNQFRQWLAKGYQGEMDYLARNVDKRAHPAQLHPGTLRIISVRMDYLVKTTDSEQVMADPELGFISRYALGRDYHKLMRKRLQQLANRIGQHIGEFGYRVFVDSAPVLEKALAEKAGIGWIGKHTNLLHRDAGSWFFLGELYTDLPLPSDTNVNQHCGRCTACIDICPTQAIVAPYQLDARRCISYLTIELKGGIPVEFRPLLGNRIYGCDDCQLACPWNRFAHFSQENDFHPRHQLNAPKLIELFAWSEEEFLKRTEGSPIRRIGHERWLRNIAVALGNGSKTAATVRALKQRQDHPSALVREHVAWALEQH